MAYLYVCARVWAHVYSSAKLGRHTSRCLRQERAEVPHAVGVVTLPQERPPQECPPLLRETASEAEQISLHGQLHGTEWECDGSRQLHRRGKERQIVTIIVPLLLFP